jgi:hypothetical protein
MKSSNLAQRLEEFDAVSELLRLVPPTTALFGDPRSASAGPREPARPVRRTGRVRAIQIRDQGLRGFRVF